MLKTHKVIPLESGVSQGFPHHIQWNDQCSAGSEEPHWAEKGCRACMAACTKAEPFSFASYSGSQFRSLQKKTRICMQVFYLRDEPGSTVREEKKWEKEHLQRCANVEDVCKQMGIHLDGNHLRDCGIHPKISSLQWACGLFIHQLLYHRDCESVLEC